MLRAIEICTFNFCTYEAIRNSFRNLTIIDSLLNDVGASPYAALDFGAQATRSDGITSALF